MINPHQLPPKSAQRLSLFEVQPGPIQALVQYCLALVMVETGKTKLTNMRPGDTGSLCTFETATGEYLSLTNPPLDNEQEKEVSI
jgi:hypothetical protein